ncbi:Uncharacterized protein TCM_032044 [Theobroma cacao]|uniref:Uncharacterized protein n=1 Tax=Theobroma cacao TaxID=3641 RepID=A0A061F9R2_THECC|nr:Uncharacterized protein TCM_032044 [Theobroma cacao]
MILHLKPTSRSSQKGVIRNTHHQVWNGDLTKNMSIQKSRPDEGAKQKNHTESGGTSNHQKQRSNRWPEPRNPEAENAH